MMARSESRVAARTASGLAEGWRCSILAPTLASTAGQSPSMAESQSGRAAGADLWVQAGLAPTPFRASARSCREAKKAFHEGSTELGSAAHFA